MDRDELVAEMADAIFRLRNVKSSALARAALAVAEPVVRGWERTTIRDQNKAIIDALEQMKKNRIEGTP